MNTKYFEVKGTGKGGERVFIDVSKVEVIKFYPKELKITYFLNTHTEHTIITETVESGIKIYESIISLRKEL